MELVSGHQQQCLVHLLQEVPVVRGGGGQYYSQNQVKGLTSASFVKCLISYLFMTQNQWLTSNPPRPTKKKRKIPLNKYFFY